MSDGHTRRHFLKTGIAASGGLVVAAWLPGCTGHEGEDDRATPPGVPPGSRAWSDAADEAERLHAYVAVHPDGRVVIRAPCPEIGQGVRTSLPMIVVEELGAAWGDVVVEQAPAEGGGAPRYGSMTVGGSDSVADYWQPLREAGATARGLLCAAAARRWGVAVESCDTRQSRVEGPDGRRLPFALLAADAATSGEAANGGEDGTPGTFAPRDPDSYRLVGTNPPRPDLRAITDGSAVYGLDVRVPDLRFAVVARPPVRGARVESLDPTATLAVEGVEQVVEVEAATPRGVLYAAAKGGVAVIARDSWAAMRGLEVLNVTWSRTTGEADHETWRKVADAALDREPTRWLRDEGDVRRAFRAGRSIEATYELPLLAHGCMEPVNFTARCGEDGCELWGPTQTPLNLQALAAEALGLPRDAVTVHSTLAGGGFGRRLAFDYGIEAALVSRTAGVPVQIVWPREQDVRHDYFRPPAVHRLCGAVDEGGRVVAWEHRLATVSLNRNIRGSEADPPELYDVQGGADHPYAVPNLRFGWTDVPLNLQLGSWRSVSHSFNVFAVESFVDEMAAAAGRDPLQLRFELLSAAPAPAAEISLPLPDRRGRPAPDRRLLEGVLRAVADDADWRTGPPGSRGTTADETRRGRGIACCYYKQSYAAHVADVAVSPDGAIRVERIYTAVDCGRVVHPDGLRAQMEGGAMDGVATVILWGVSLENGRVRESNFHDYRLLRHADAPEVVTRIIDSRRPPSGAGEAPYPAVPAAITSAIFDATGVRVRRLPVESVDMSMAREDEEVRAD